MRMQTVLMIAALMLLPASAAFGEKSMAGETGAAMKSEPMMEKPADKMTGKGAAMEKQAAEPMMEKQGSGAMTDKGAGTMEKGSMDKKMHEQPKMMKKDKEKMMDKEAKSMKEEGKDMMMEKSSPEKMMSK